MHSTKIYLEKFPQMAKYDKGDKPLKEFEQTVREIMGICGELEDEDSFEDSIEYVISDALSDSLSDEPSFGDNSSSSTVEEILFIPSRTSCGSKLEDSEDFPAGNCDSEASAMVGQLKHLNVDERMEYKDARHIINVEKRKKKIGKRCKNLDD